MTRLMPDEGPDPTGEAIAAADIEELEASVVPWQFDMRQMSRGAMDARIRLGLVGDILATREHWSKKVVANGVSPPGYLALGGTGSRQSYKWCGRELDSRYVFCGLDAADCDFATPDEERHWVLLIPQKTLAGYLDPQSVESLRGRRVLRCGPELSSRLFALTNRAVQPFGGRNPGGQKNPETMILRAELLEAASQLVSSENRERRFSKRRRQYRVWRRAVSLIDSLRIPIKVPELASQVGVSRRTLERAFEGVVGVSPYRFTRLHRLNRLHRELRQARGHQISVTELLEDWGFTNLGRTAVEYKRLFGESPSKTLAEESSPSSLKLADALKTGPVRTSTNP